MLRELKPKATVMLRRLVTANRSLVGAVVLSRWRSQGKVLLSVLKDCDRDPDDANMPRRLQEGCVECASTWTAGVKPGGPYQRSRTQVSVSAVKCDAATRIKARRPFARKGRGSVRRTTPVWSAHGPMLNTATGFHHIPLRNTRLEQARFRRLRHQLENA